jgi:hypothetical protein
VIDVQRHAIGIVGDVVVEDIPRDDRHVRQPGACLVVGDGRQQVGRGRIGAVVDADVEMIDHARF